jgi:hypothetical protein
MRAALRGGVHARRASNCPARWTGRWAQPGARATGPRRPMCHRSPQNHAVLAAVVAPARRPADQCARSVVRRRRAPAAERSICTSTPGHRRAPEAATRVGSTGSLLNIMRARSVRPERHVGDRTSSEPPGRPSAGRVLGRSRLGEGGPRTSFGLPLPPRSSEGGHPSPGQSSCTSSRAIGLCNGCRSCTT